MGLDMYAYFAEEEMCGKRQTDIDVGDLKDDAY